MFRKYKVDTLCENCNTKTILYIPKGRYVYEFLETEAKCGNCGCRIRKLVNEDIDPDTLRQDHKKELSSLKERLKTKKNGN